MTSINLKRLREEKKLTQEALADILGYSRNSMVSQLEHGVRKNPKNLKDKLTNALGDISDYEEDYEVEKPNMSQEKYIEVPASLLTDIKKLIETIHSQQRSIEKLVDQITKKL